MQVDNLLPITTPKIWIALIGAVVLLLAGGIYLAGTPHVTSVATEGRVVAASGVVSIESAVGMSLETVMVGEGDVVGQGESLASGVSADGEPVELRSPGDGTVWQLLASPGQAVAAGETFMTLLPAGSGGAILVPVKEEAAQGIQIGQKANLSGAGIVAQGVVTEVSTTPLPGVRAAELTALPLDPLATYVLVSVTTSDALPSGAEVQVEIVESESTVLRELVSFT
ncbi:MAG: HlyD family efflux transporter periplasmic adaptor subunit [Actinobacteria bacterium]|nr:HlyD family efflux transporter periplasmic adaptor subunit [Actinomycetota bacterium]